MRNIELTGYQSERLSTVDSFTKNLPELLGAMVLDGGCLIALAEFADGRYVQFWVDPEVFVIGEVLSNLNIGDAIALSPEDEEVLRGIGFSEPVPGPNPNWRYQATSIDTFARLVNMMNLAIYRVLQEGPNNPVKIRTWEMARPLGVSVDEVRETRRLYFEQFLDQLEEIAE
jgi:hypothetical protein